jgi:hypothetical protein
VFEVKFQPAEKDPEIFTVKQPTPAYREAGTGQGIFGLQELFQSLQKVSGSVGSGNLSS